MPKMFSMPIACRDLSAAAGLLTRLPIRVNTDHAQMRGAHAAWCYPLIGALLAMVSAAVALSAIAFGMSPAIGAGVVLIVSVVLSGGLHEDGLADTADGFWGGWTVERRLEIMKDSQIGTYGVLALILSIGLRWVLLDELIASQNLFTGMISATLAAQASMVVLWASTPPARPSGLATQTGRPDRTTATIAVVISVTGLVALCGAGQTLGLIAAMAVVIFGMRALCQNKIRGHTGDVLGATQQIALIVALALIATPN